MRITTVSPCKCAALTVVTAATTATTVAWVGEDFWTQQLKERMKKGLNMTTSLWEALDQMELLKRTGIAGKFTAAAPVVGTGQVGAAVLETQAASHAPGERWMPGRRNSATAQAALAAAKNGGGGGA
jgi:hypothetical protein